MANSQPISWGSDEVNGQLVPRPPSSAFFPLTMGAQYRGPGMYQSRSPYTVPPVIPTAAIAANPSPQAQDSGKSGGHWHPTQGTILFGFGSLVAGLFMLHYIHYGSGD